MNDERDLAEPGWDMTEPIDMTSVHADDRFLDALSQDQPVPTQDDTEYHLAELLSGWRHDVVTEPVPDLPTVDDVETAIAATERARRGRGIIRHLRVASGAAAIVVIAGAGLTVLAEGSSPGDPLWGVKRVVFSEAASQTQASMDVQSNLEKAEAAVAAGDTAQAAELIAKAQKNLGPVRDADTRDRMNAWIERLRADPAVSKASSAASSAARSIPGSVGGGGTSVDPSITDPAAPPRDLRRSGVDDRSSVTVPNPPPPVTSDPPTDARTGEPSTIDTPPPVTQVPPTTELPPPTTATATSVPTIDPPETIETFPTLTTTLPPLG
ncbi:anti-sigma-D factor RsdA [Gordonia insulae]|uniref:Anti-sigma-D factor RsdA n=1 Tax=Gordonia insulae TaxID=2420509 RepID=A0A3G8JIL7_9ACTN|nr:anti-sigma-D factor RsdA [Gordonia insulae]AZG44941.1 Anti-sigma-D factor RsdA [Gordonia insulae]